MNNRHDRRIPGLFGIDLRSGLYVRDARRL